MPSWSFTGVGGEENRCYQHLWVEVMSRAGPSLVRHTRTGTFSLRRNSEGHQDQLLQRSHQKVLVSNTSSRKGVWFPGLSMCREFSMKTFFLRVWLNVPPVAPQLTGSRWVHSYCLTHLPFRYCFCLALFNSQLVPFRRMFSCSWFRCFRTIFYPTVPVSQVL